jgi:hypothetical protein
MPNDPDVPESPAASPLPSDLAAPRLEARVAPTQPPRGALAAFDELLKEPQQLVRRAAAGGPPSPAPWLVAGALACFALYGAVAGLFQGGAQVAVTALKAPLVIAMSLALCLPSLYILTALAGVALPRRLFASLVAGFAGTLALLFVALLPITWLFSVSSRSLTSAVWLQLIAWVVAAAFGVRFLGRALTERGGRRVVALWFCLFLLVSFQVATYLRPVLWRAPGAPLFAPGKMSFFEHLGTVYQFEEDREKAEADEKAKAEAANAARAKAGAAKSEPAKAAPARAPAAPSR